MHQCDAEAGHTPFRKKNTIDRLDGSLFLDRNRWIFWFWIQLSMMCAPYDPVGSASQFLLIVLIFNSFL
jgi:hypothetical protein